MTLNDIPVRDRFSYWWETVAQSVVPVHATSDRADDFWAEMTMIDFDGIALTRVRCASFDAIRTQALIRRSDPELYQLSLTLRGRSGIQQLGREISLGPSDVTLYDTSRSFQAWTDADEGPAPGVDRQPGGGSDGVILQIPRDALPLAAKQVDRLLAVRMSGRNGIGAVLDALLRQVAIGSGPFAVPAAAYLSRAIVDLVAGLLTQQLGEIPRSTPEGRQDALMLRVQAYIEMNLANPELSPNQIAAAHHVSLRHLQKVFEQDGLTVASWIRRRRLERCRRDLADPLLMHRTVYAIAARWGFVAESHFTRAFRAEYGVPPGRWRRSHRAGDTNDAAIA